MRARLLELGLAAEADLTPDPQPGDHWLLINSLGCRPIRRLDEMELEVHLEAEALWRSLL
jgi:4-amino-4-deoxychorismate lyase